MNDDLGVDGADGALHTAEDIADWAGRTHYVAHPGVRVFLLSAGKKADGYGIFANLEILGVPHDSHDPVNRVGLARAGVQAKRTANCLPAPEDFLDEDFVDDGDLFGVE